MFLTNIGLFCKNYAKLLTSYLKYDILTHWNICICSLSGDTEVRMTNKVKTYWRERYVDNDENNFIDSDYFCRCFLHISIR